MGERAAPTTSNRRVSAGGPSQRVQVDSNEDANETPRRGAGNDLDESENS